MEAGNDRPNRHSDTMRIDIRPEDMVEDKQKKKIVVHRRRLSPHGDAEVSEISEVGATLGGPAFQKLLHNIYDAVVITDIEGRNLSANERATVFFRCDEEFLRERGMTELISGADENLISTILKNLEQDRFTLIQADCIRQDGSTFPAEISANRIDLSKRECITFFIRDVTRRKAQEEQLRTGYYAIQNSGGGIMITDRDLNLTYSNPSMQTMLGCERPEQIDGVAIRRFFMGEGILEAMQYLEENPYWNGELEIEGLQKEQAFVHVSIVKNISSENLLTGYIFSLMDVTRERRANLQLAAYAEELRRNNDEMRKDLAMARDIQRALLPTSYPQYYADDACDSAVIEYGHIYIPSGEIGGDFFDVISLSDSKLGIFIADVSGHGMRAALITATLRGMVEELACESRRPEEFMQALNMAYTSIFRITDDFSFVTAAYAVVDTQSGAVEFTIAGHPEPIVISPHQKVGRIEIDHCEGTPAIGLLGERDVKFGSFCTRLHSGDVLLMYTDGIFEELNASGEEYGLERLEKRLSEYADLPLDDMLDGIVSDVRKSTGRQEFVDDVCMLAISFDRREVLSV